MSDSPEKSWWGRLFKKEDEGELLHLDMSQPRDTMELDLKDLEHFLTEDSQVDDFPSGAPSPSPLKTTNTATPVTDSGVSAIQVQSQGQPSSQLQSLLDEMVVLQRKLELTQTVERQLNDSLEGKERSLENAHQMLTSLEAENEALRQERSELQALVEKQTEESKRISELESLLEDTTARLYQEQAKRNQWKKEQEAALQKVALQENAVSELDEFRQQSKELTFFLWHVAVRSLQRACGRGAESSMLLTWEELFPFLQDLFLRDVEVSESGLQKVADWFQKMGLCETLQWELDDNSLRVEAMGLPDTLLSYDDSPELQQIKSPIVPLLSALWGQANPGGFTCSYDKESDYGSLQFVLRRSESL
ncbi:MAG: hypothetical protein EP343_06355 [Deltaproteobacteria bacterium]|nr:MAG: hypothetical protein EP343_06355 [Deltaproteobacteria bacterium]